VIEERLGVYEPETRPVLEFYERRGLLRTLDANGSAEDVAGRAASLVTAALTSA
jgi:adenylate kinase